MKFKKIVLALLIVSMILTSLPFEAKKVNAVESETILAKVEKQVKAYAESINTLDEPDSQALSDLVSYSMKAKFNSNIEELKLGADDATTISLLNSNMLQESLSYSIAGTIENMQSLERDKLYAHGGMAWYSHKSSYTTYAYPTEEKNTYKRIGTVASSKSLYGSDGYPTESFNDNDKAMVLVVGSASMGCEVEVAEVKSDTVIYNVNAYVYDDFDFNGDYSGSAELGYDVSLAEGLKNVGAALLGEFSWRSDVSFQIEVPYGCSHESNSYRWTMGEDGQLTCATSEEGFTVNAATTTKYVPSSTATTTKDYYYHTLEETVKLKHNQPWVMEYAGKKISSLYLLQTTATASMTPCYLHSASKTAMFRAYETITLTEEEKAILEADSSAKIAKNIYHYYGLDTTDMYNKAYSKNTLRFRMENVVNGNTNMIYLSIYNEDTGEVLLEPTPMDDYYQKKSYESSRSLVEEQCEWISGQDFYLNYIGNRSYPLKAETFQLTVWENGEGVENKSSFVATETAGSCVQQGTITKVCSECGYTEVEYTGFADHNYGQFKLNYDTTCTKDGTQTAICKDCGIECTIPVEGSAKGHKEKEVKEKAPTCQQAGYTEGVVCTECDEILTGCEELEILPHMYGEYVSDGNATCLEDGTMTRICTACGAEDTVIEENSAKGHVKEIVFGYEAECMKTGLTDGVICAACNEVLEKQTEIPALEHKFGEFISNNDATCKEEGTKTRTCELCGAKDTVEDRGTKKSHVPADVKGYAATCTEAGITDGKVCAVCNEIIEGQEVIEALGHACEEFTSNKDAICGQDGTKTGTCSVCKEIVTIVDEGSGQAHTEKVVEGYAATCTAEGLTDGSVCTGCGAVVAEQKPIEKLPHTEKILEGYAATCTTNGLSDGSICTECNTIIQEQMVIKSLGHMFSAYISDNNATASADGTKTATCIACGEKDTVLDVGSIKEQVNTGNNNSDKSPTTGDYGFIKYAIGMCVSAAYVLIIWKRKKV